MASLTKAEPESKHGNKVFDLFEGWKLGGRRSAEKSTRDILRELQDSSEEEEELDGQPQAQEEKSETDRQEQKAAFWNDWLLPFKKLSGADEEDQVRALVEKAHCFHELQRSSKVEEEIGLEDLQEEIEKVAAQVNKSFAGDINVKLLNPISFNYFLEYQESKKTPSWKIRKHRFCSEIDDLDDEIMNLHDALYLAESSYLDSHEAISEALEKYQGEQSYEMIYCSVEAEPRQPAHYIAISKSVPKRSGPFPWQKSNALELLFVVRGTKELSDVLSDCLLDSCEYGGSFAHDGVCKSGLSLVEKHSEFLKHLLEESGRSSIRLQMVGHSLGAGAAAIATMEFNKNPHIQATCVGFGCPALVTKELSESCQEYVTTVVCDADCVSRMSKATVSNLIGSIMSHDWTQRAVSDVEDLLQVLQANTPFEIPIDHLSSALGWVRESLGALQPEIQAARSKDTMLVELFPPGRVIHIYRHSEVSVRQVSCTFFDELDVCRTMVSDHLVASGYDQIFHDFARQHKRDSRFFFRNDVKGLRAEKHLRG